MNYEELVEVLPDEAFSRKDVYKSAIQLETDFSDTLMRNLMEYLMNGGYIHRVARNVYVKNIYFTSKLFKGEYSKTTKQLLKLLEKEFPDMNYQVWELNWLNEFVNLLYGSNLIFIEVENFGCEFVYNKLIEKGYKNVLLRPNNKELSYYTSDGCIIVDRLITQAPTSYDDPHSPALEKIIVDLFSNKKLMSLVDKSEYRQILTTMFQRYKIDEHKLWRYASRRNKEKEIIEFINKETEIYISRR